mgnify:CR=1 FL=1
MGGLHHLRQDHYVAPRKGAWIEIVATGGTNNKGMSPLAKGRGLKYAEVYAFMVLARRPSQRGVD